MMLGKMFGRSVLLAFLLWIIIYWVHRSTTGVTLPHHVEVYIERYAPAAKTLSELSGIPVAIPLAVGGLESGWGSSDLAKKGNNHFGIKAHGSKSRICLPTVEFFFGRRHQIRDCFRSYSNAEDSYFDFTRFLLSEPRYDTLFHIPVSDYKDWAQGLQDCGYATDPHYAKKLIRVIEQYNLHQL